MMVIRAGDTGRIFSADRCTWIQADGTGGRGYTITSAFFYTGIGDDVATQIMNPELGFIGKSGRFVEISQ